MMKAASHIPSGRKLDEETQLIDFQVGGFLKGNVLCGWLVRSTEKEKCKENPALLGVILQSSDHQEKKVNYLLHKGSASRFKKRKW